MREAASCFYARSATHPLKMRKVCSNLGMPLGEWRTEAERDAELHEFAEKVRHQS